MPKSIDIRLILGLTGFSLVALALILFAGYDVNLLIKTPYWDVDGHIRPSIERSK